MSGGLINCLVGPIVRWVIAKLPPTLNFLYAIGRATNLPFTGRGSSAGWAPSRLTAKKPGSATSPTLVIEYGTTLLL